MAAKTAKPAKEEAALPEVDQSVQTTTAMLNAVHELFADTATELTLPICKLKVEFYPAKFKHIEQITLLFSALVSGLSSVELKGMMEMVSTQQEGQINAGVSPYLIDTDNLVKQASGNASLALKLLSGITGQLPELIAMFTDLTPEQFGELDVDESMIVAFHIFARNYSFFTQRLLPVIVASSVKLTSLASQK